MPSTKNYRNLRERVTSRPGATERLDALRADTLAEVGLYELRKTLERSQADLAAELNISQSAVSQLERADDIKLSTLRNYLSRLGARLEIVAVFNEDDERRVPIQLGDGDPL